MAFYDDMVAVVDEMLAPVSEGGFGKDMAYIRVTPTTTSDPAAGTVTPGTPVDTLVKAIQTEHSEEYMPGALVELGDVFYILDTLPNIEDQLVIDGELFEIVKIWPKKPGSDFLACAVQTRA